jgi:hypothetical protein
MDVFKRPDRYSKAPATRSQEPQGPIYSGTPVQVAQYLGARMDERLHTLSLVAAELVHLARAGWSTDSLTFVLEDDTSVTVRP